MFLGFLYSLSSFLSYGDVFKMPKLNVKQVVKGILEGNPQARERREGSSWLIYLVWKEYINFFIPSNIIKNIPTPETILRTRRDIQHKDNEFNEEKDIIPDPNITYEKPEVENGKDDKIQE